MLKVSFGSLKQSADYNFRLEFLILPSSGWLEPTCDTRIIHFYYMLEHLSMDKTTNKHSLRNEKLKANRNSETEEQRKERLRMRREKDRARRRTKKLEKKLQEENKRSSETEDHEKQRLVTLKTLKRGDENELERKLRLEKVVASKQLRLAVETEEERRARLENDAATKQLGWPWRG